MNAPPTGARILTITKAGFSLDPYIIIENKDEILSANIHYEESNDQNVWQTVPGSTVEVEPGRSNGQIVSTNMAFIALYAQGNVDIEVTVVRQHNGDVASPMQL